MWPMDARARITQIKHHEDIDRIHTTTHTHSRKRLKIFRDTQSRVEKRGKIRNFAREEKYEMKNRKIVYVQQRHTTDGRFDFSI